MDYRKTLAKLQAKVDLQAAAVKSTGAELEDVLKRNNDGKYTALAKALSAKLTRQGLALKVTNQHRQLIETIIKEEQTTKTK